MGKIHLLSLTFATKIALVPIFCGRQKHYELDVFRHIESPPSFDPKLEGPKMHFFPKFSQNFNGGRVNVNIVNSQAM